MSVVPSHATPSTQIDADIPDLNTGVLRTSAAGTLVTSRITVAAVSMMVMIASLRGSVGSEISPSWSEVIVAHAMTTRMATRKIHTEVLASLVGT